MRRENLKQQGGGDAYIDWLKSKGCRFYAPMDEEHGTDELIQGWAFGVNNGCSCTWESSQNAYLVSGSTSTSKASAMWSGKNIQPQCVGQRVAQSVSFTVLCDFKLTQKYADWAYGYMYGGSDTYAVNGSGTSSSRNLLTFSAVPFYTRNGYSCDLNNWYTLFGGRELTYSKWCDVNSQGVTMMEDSNGSWEFVYNQNVDTHVSLCAACYGYFRNLYIFDKMLGDEDIMTIYNHDHQ